MSGIESFTSAPVNVHLQPEVLQSGQLIIALAQNKQTKQEEKRMTLVEVNYCP